MFPHVAGLHFGRVKRLERLLRRVAFLDVFHGEEVGGFGGGRRSSTETLAVGRAVDPFCTSYHVVFGGPFENPPGVVITTIGEVHFVGGGVGDLRLQQFVVIGRHNLLCADLLGNEVALLDGLAVTQTSLLTKELRQRFVFFVCEVRQVIETCSLRTATKTIAEIASLIAGMLRLQIVQFEAAERGISYVSGLLTEEALEVLSVPV